MEKQLLLVLDESDLTKQGNQKSLCDITCADFRTLKPVYEASIVLLKKDDEYRCFKNRYPLTLNVKKENKVKNFIKRMKYRVQWLAIQIQMIWFIIMP